MAKKKKYTPKQLAIIRRNYAIKAQQKPNPARTKSGLVPQGRTITTNDNYLADGKRTGSTAEHPAVVIEANANNELAIVPMSTKDGKNRTRLPNYQQGQSYYKHFVEIEDDEGNPIVINEKFRENHLNMDVSNEDVMKIRDRVLQHSAPAPQNREKIEKFRKRKSPRN